MPTVSIVIPYAPRGWQRRVHDSEARFRVVVCHRRAGKTVLAVNELIRAAFKKPGRYAYVAPSYKMAKGIAWDLFKKFVPWELVDKANESELSIRFKNGGLLELYGSENEQALRGREFHGVVFDEYAQQGHNVFTEIILPTLATTNGWVMWIGTPQGRNQFWEVWNSAHTRKSWERFMLKASESGIIPAEELATQRANMDEAEYQQEFECAFDVPVRGAVYKAEWQVLRDEGRYRQVKYDPQLATYSAWDFGVADSTAILVFQVLPAFGEVRLIHEYEKNGVPLDHYIAWLKSLKAKDGTPYRFRSHFGDPSGHSRNLVTGRSIFEDLARQGVPMYARRSWKKDQIHAAKKLLNRLVVSDTCTRFEQCAMNYKYTWDEGRNQWSDEPFHDEFSHMMDALAYMAVNYQEQAAPKTEVERKLEAFKRRNQPKFSQSFFAG